MDKTTHTIYLSRTNLLTLLSKLERKKKGAFTHCTVIKRDYKHPKYPQSMFGCEVIALEDSEYYLDREPGLPCGEDRILMDKINKAISRIK